MYNLYLPSMNFLAHIYLSGDNDQIRIGNFMADSIKGRKYLKYSKDLQKGIILHRAIDYYTDTHPVFRQSTQRLFAIYYDHFLAANWEKYCDINLESYTHNFYKLLNDNFDVLPGRVKNFLPYMINDNWLLSYAEFEGIEKVFAGMNRRTGRKSNMDRAMEDLKEFYLLFQQEFEDFFEEVQRFSEAKILEIGEQ